MCAVRQLDINQALCIHGIFEGDLEVANTVFIGREGMVSANLTAGQVIVQGVVIGSIRAGEVEICASGKVWGNVCTQAFHVEPGGFVRGQIITPFPTEHTLHAYSPESSAAPGALSLQPHLDDALDHLLAKLEAAAQEAISVDTPQSSPQPLHIKEALARVADAKNWTISQLQLELQATQAALAEQEALIATVSTDLARAGNEHEAAVVRQNAELRRELERTRMTALQHHQSLARLHVELEKTREALDAAQDEITHLSTDLAEARAQLQSPSDELARSQARYDHLVATTAEASEQLCDQLAEVMAERDQAVADLNVTQVHAAERDDLRANLERLRDEYTTAQTIVGQLTDDLDADRAEIERLNSDHSAALSVVQAERDDASAGLEAARQRIAQLSGQLAAEQEAARTDVERLTADLDAARLQAGFKTHQDQIGQQRVYTAYCLTCHTHRPIVEVREIVMPDGRRAVKGRCTVCGAILLNLVTSD